VKPANRSPGATHQARESPRPETWTLLVNNGWIQLCESCAATLTKQTPVGDYTIAAVVIDSAGNRTSILVRRRVLQRPSVLSCASNAVNFGELVTLSSTLD
jgi:hypothetical protein